MIIMIYDEYNDDLIGLVSRSESQELSRTLKFWPDCWNRRAILSAPNLAHARMSRREVRLGLTDLVVGMVMPILMGQTNIERLFPNSEEYFFLSAMIMSNGHA